MTRGSGTFQVHGFPIPTELFLGVYPELLPQLSPEIIQGEERVLFEAPIQLILGSLINTPLEFQEELPVCEGNMGISI